MFFGTRFVMNCMKSVFLTKTQFQMPTPNFFPFWVIRPIVELFPILKHIWYLKKSETKLIHFHFLSYIDKERKATQSNISKNCSVSIRSTVFLIRILTEMEIIEKRNGKWKISKGAIVFLFLYRNNLI